MTMLDWMRLCERDIKGFTGPTIKAKCLQCTNGQVYANDYAVGDLVWQKVDACCCRTCNGTGIADFYKEDASSIAMSVLLFVSKTEGAECILENNLVAISVAGKSHEVKHNGTDTGVATALLCCLLSVMG